MVSPLSSRILNLEAKAKINREIIHAPLPPTAGRTWIRSNSKSKRVSGYSADRESASVSVPIQYEKQKRVDQVEAQAKRRKIDELNFQAANVREDLKESGIQCRPGLFGRSRALPIGSVDMSTVKLIVRSKGQPCHEAVSRKLPPDEVPSTETYSDLLIACQSFYKTNGPINFAAVNADGYHDRAPSTTSTITTGESISPTSDGDSDSDDIPLIIPARLKESTRKEGKNLKVKEDELNLEPLSSSCLSLEDALHNKESAT